ncbi:NUMOD4 domain-containing protein [Companilactobacillus sp.]|uniref:NUMOD4 domain-containing protein n=1 Tax=Companilactobacillus sp. TaxID=2767905 RepID=UPI00261DD982|nr:NUMOD4 domain-containing protein [Companilactobacillus sp.]
MTNNEEEVWKSHPDIVGIEVSTFGNVRTLDRVVSSENGTRFLKWRVLKQSYNDKGYLKANIPIMGNLLRKRFTGLLLKYSFPTPTTCQKLTIWIAI